MVSSGRSRSGSTLLNNRRWRSRTVSGSLGCNDFATQPFTFEDGLLIPGEFMQTAMLCTGLDGTDAMSIERIIKGLSQ